MKLVKAEESFLYFWALYKQSVVDLHISCYTTLMQSSGGANGLIQQMATVCRPGIQSGSSPTYLSESFFKNLSALEFFFPEPRRVELISYYQGRPAQLERKMLLFLWTLTWDDSQSVSVWHSPHPGLWSRLDSSIASLMESPAPAQCSTTCQEKKKERKKTLWTNKTNTCWDPNGSSGLIIQSAHCLVC